MDRDKMIEKIARIICENGIMDCLCPYPQRVACTPYNKARDILNEIIPDGAVVLTKEELETKSVFDDDDLLDILDAERQLERQAILNKMWDIILQEAEKDGKDAAVSVIDAFVEIVKFLKRSENNEYKEEDAE